MMDKLNLVKTVLYEHGGIAKTSQFSERGLSNYDVTYLCNKGYIKRIRHGVYQLPDSNDVTEEKLIKTVLPEVVVCLESALFHYGYSDFVPRKWSIAVPRSISLGKLTSIAVNFNVFYVTQEKLALGKLYSDFNGTSLAVYDKDKTICDCFKYRTKLDNEIFNKAIKAYVSDEKKNLGNLAMYAKEMGIYNKVMNIMEVLLND